jgi:hypothetical protein
MTITTKYNEQNIAAQIAHVKQTEAYVKFMFLQGYKVVSNIHDTLIFEKYKEVRNEHTKSSRNIAN